MGRVRNLRLPDDMEDDVDKYLVDNKVKFTDLVISGITSIIYPAIQSPVRLVVGAKYAEGKLVDIPEKAKKPECNDMPAVKIVPVTSPGEAEKPAGKPDIADTVYLPDPARPVKQPKASSKATPIVKSLLSGIVKQPTVSHHPCCSCGVCKP